MIKVCHMTSAHPQEDVRIFHKECVSLANAGYEVYLVSCGKSYNKNGVHIIGVGEMPANRMKRMTQGAKMVYQKALELDCDIYHFHDPELLPYGLKLKRKGKRVIFDSHEKYAYQLKSKPYLPKFITVPVAKGYDIYERHILKRIDAVVFPCTMGGKNPFEGQCKRSFIISNAAVLGEFYDLYNADYKKNDRQICYVGGLTEDRGITAAILSASKADAVLALAGEFSPEEYHFQVQSRSEYQCVDWRGKLNRKEVADLLLESVIGICTLLDRGQYLKIDTFGIKVFEYMSMGLPVILSKSPYNEKMIEQYQFGICVDPENIDEFANAIRYIFEHPDEAKQMGENGRRAVKEKFNWAEEEKKLLRLYRQLI